jgi:hypothetical protein
MALSLNPATKIVGRRNQGTCSSTYKMASHHQAIDAQSTRERLYAFSLSKTSCRLYLSFFYLGCN